MKIIVTGALGHIGSALIRYLPIEFPDAEIIMIDNLYTQRYCSLFNLPKGNYKFIEADARFCKLPSHTHVIHLAAYTEPHAQLDWKHNIDATYNIAVQSSRIIFASTLSVLPEAQTAYAATKFKEEEIIRNRGGIVLRLGNLFGPSPGMRFHTVVSKMCWQAVNRQPLTVWETALDQRRPYLDLIDVVRAICFCIKWPSGTFNLVTQIATLAKVISYIEADIPVSFNLEESPSMNRIDQDILGTMPSEFVFKGNLEKGIANTIAMLRHG